MSKISYYMTVHFPTRPVVEVLNEKKHPGSRTLDVGHLTIHCDDEWLERLRAEIVAFQMEQDHKNDNRRERQEYEDAALDTEPWDDPVEVNTRTPPRRPHF